MSRFVETLAGVGQHLAAPMGFGPASRHRDAAPNFVLTGRVTPQALRENPGLAEAKVDALLLWQDTWDEAALDGTTDILKERLWGAHLGGTGLDQVKRLQERGCDFIVFDAESTEAGVLNEEALGKFISIAGELSEDMARGISELPIDGAFLARNEELLPLTVRKIIDIGLLSWLMEKPIAMAAPRGLSPGDLETLMNAGIAGLVVELTSVKEIAKTRKAIESLPRPRTASPRREALLPPSIPATGADLPGPGEEGDGDGDEDEDF